MAPGVPYHTYRRGDSLLMIPGEPELLSIELQPTSVLFKKGHRIRVAIAGADKDHFALPDGPAPQLKIYRDEDHPSRIDLPVIPR